MDVEKTTAPVCTCPSGDRSLRWPCPAHGAVPAINLQHEALGFVLFPLSPAAVAPHVAEYIIGFDFDEVRDVYGKRFAVFWQGLVDMFAGQPGAQTYSIDADPAGIRARVADVITGTLMVGAQGHTPPPAGHWAEPFWQMARSDAAAQGIDLEQLRALAEEWKQLEYPLSYEGQQAQRATNACSADLLALIDQRAAATEVTNG
ncbi:hypothetical protein V8017_00315 [Stenotrophomonas rhizophila]